MEYKEIKTVIILTLIITTFLAMFELNITKKYYLNKSKISFTEVTTYALKIKNTK
ncbi:hypothetical protein EV143_10272 [Flavobacterium chryseum]|uniref:hypothetical protein n=1 Tax=Flavobacterium sp. P3160 TaxID=2512113 RepID=UPI0010E5DAF0|nr:hypothetical protein [Flavobacterium sp. P3160]TDO82812.1 hypothetical protein EV143_10272 [Flavobacterium sp. P3160]